MDIQRLDLFQDVSRAKSGPLPEGGASSPARAPRSGEEAHSKDDGRNKEPCRTEGKAWPCIHRSSLLIYISIRDGYLLFWRAQAILTPHHFRDEVVRVQIRDIKELVESTADAAFAIDGSGLIVRWNRAAEAMFETTAARAIAKPCGQLLQGVDESGPVCSPNCLVQQAIRKRRPVRNFDLQVKIRQGRLWCNISVLIVHEAGSSLPYALHIIRPMDVRKRLELLMRDLVLKETGLSPEQVIKMISVTRAPAREADLTNREIEILRLLAQGVTSASIAARLHISRTTVNNHVRHILPKLEARLYWG